jgi:hypothetical protein
MSELGNGAVRTGTRAELSLYRRLWRGDEEQCSGDDK